MIYEVNRGIGRVAEFKGLQSQYLFIFAGGLLGSFLVTLILYFCAIPQLICILIGLLLGGFTVFQTFRLNKKYGRYGLMKERARRYHPRYIKNDRTIELMLDQRVTK